MADDARFLRAIPSATLGVGRLNRSINVFLCSLELAVCLPRLMARPNPASPKLPVTQIISPGLALLLFVGGLHVTVAFLDFPFRIRPAAVAAARAPPRLIVATDGRVYGEVVGQPVTRLVPGAGVGVYG